MTTNRTAKITALLQKTVANGCTQAEADAARALAERLMTKYGISETECQPPVTRRSAPSGAAQSWEDFFRRAQERPTCRCHLQWTDVTASFAKGPHHTMTSCPMWEPEAPKPNASWKDDFDPYKPDHRGRSSHRHCAHEATPAARAKCRKERAARGR